MAPVNDAVVEDLSLLPYADLLEKAKEYREAYNDILSDSRTQNDTIQGLQRRISSLPSSISLKETRSNWVRAEIDHPDDKSSSCFGEKSKYSTFITYEPGRSVLRSGTKPEANQVALYSRLPSRRVNTIYVFVESVMTGPSNSTRRYRVSTRKQAPDGFIHHWTIHLKRLSWGARAQIWIGQIKWLYILLDPETAEKKR